MRGRAPRIRARPAPVKEAKTDINLAATAPVGGVVVKEDSGIVPEAELAEAAMADAMEPPIDAADDAPVPPEAPAPRGLPVPPAQPGRPAATRR